MLEIKTFEELITDAAKELGDPNFQRYSEDEISEFLNNGQWEFVRDSKCLRSRAPIIAKENQRIFNFPDDILLNQVLRLEDKDGDEILPRTSKTLAREFGTAFRNRDAAGTSKPSFYYSDLAGEGQFELYPPPNTAFEKSPIEFTVGSFSAQISLEETALALDADDTRLWILTTNHLYTYVVDGDNFTLESDVTHGDALSYVVGQSTPLRVMKRTTTVGNASSINTYGTAFYVNGTAIKYITNDGTEGTLVTASSTVGNLLEMEFNTPTHLYYQTTDFEMYRVDFATTTETALVTETELVHFSTGNYENRNIYYSVGTTGLKKINTTSHAVSTILTADVDGVGAVRDTDNSVYFLDHTAGFIKKVDPSDDSLTTTTLTITKPYDAAVVNPIRSLGQDKFWYVDRDTTNFGITVDFWQEVDEGAKSRTAFYPIATSDFTVGSRNTLAGDNTIIATKTTFADTSVVVWNSSFEFGVISNIDNFQFDQDQGSLTDIIDSTEVINFSNETGVVSNIVVDTDIAYVNYVRCPQKDVIEIDPYWALIHYVKYRAKLRDGNAKSTREAATHLTEFKKYVNRAKSEAGMSYVSSSNGTKLVNF